MTSALLSRIISPTIGSIPPSDITILTLSSAVFNTHVLEVKVSNRCSYRVSLHQLKLHNVAVGALLRHLTRHHMKHCPGVTGSVPSLTPAYTDRLAFVIACDILCTLEIEHLAIRIPNEF